jgi:hypothetical protein
MFHQQGVRVAQPVEGDARHAGLLYERDEAVVDVAVVGGVPISLVKTRS